MKLTLPLYEGDSIIHRMAHGHAATVRTGPRLRRRAGSAVLPRLIRTAGLALAKAGDWLERSAYEARQRKLEAYLALAIDHADLERRMHAIERREVLPYI